MAASWQDSIAGQTKVTKEFKLRQTQLRTTVDEHFVRKPMTAKAKAKVKKFGGHAPPKSKVRWFAACAEDGHKHILAWAPPGLKVTADDANGRYLIGYGMFPRKIFSWTKRGQEEAVLQVLAQAWSWHEDTTGQKCPVPADFFVAD